MGLSTTSTTPVKTSKHNVSSKLSCVAFLHKNVIHNQESVSFNPVKICWKTFTINCWPFVNHSQKPHKYYTALTCLIRIFRALTTVLLACLEILYNKFVHLSGKTFLFLFQLLLTRKLLHFVCRGEAYRYRGSWTDDVF